MKEAIKRSVELNKSSTYNEPSSHQFNKPIENGLQIGELCLGKNYHADKKNSITVHCITAQDTGEVVHRGTGEAWGFFNTHKKKS